MSNWHKGYECSCGKVYDKSIANLPGYCRRCGNKMYEHYKLVGENAFGVTIMWIVDSQKMLKR